MHNGVYKDGTPAGNTFTADFSTAWVIRFPLCHRHLTIATCTPCRKYSPIKRCTLPLGIESAFVESQRQIPSIKLSMPEDDVTLWSWCTFSFIEPLFALANSRTLHDEDVWTLSPYFRHKVLFEKYLDYKRRHPDHSLLRFLLASNSLDLILDVALEMWSVVVGACLRLLIGTLSLTSE